MHTVTELHSFSRAADTAGMSPRDVERLVHLLATNPDAGEEIRGTGGCRKLRFALERSARGKSGGVRVITFFTGLAMPVFLITVFAKNQKVTLSQAECNGLRDLTDQIVRSYNGRRQAMGKE